MKIEMILLGEDKQMGKTITFKGSELHLFGRDLRLGEKAPDFRAVLGDLKPARLHEFDDQIKIITSFPSLDTAVCERQVKEFNARARELGPDIVIMAISRDLPFAQKRFCESFQINNIVLLSDARDASFGINYGVLIREWKLLARGVFILDRNNLLRYRQIVAELTREPDYGQAFSELEKIQSAPVLPGNTDTEGRCLPCEGGIPALTKVDIAGFLSRAPGWGLVEDHKISQDFKFKDDLEAKDFVDAVAIVANEQDHHPHLDWVYNKVKVTLWTHAIKGLSRNDLVLAGIIDQLAY